jgi:hypothetical protein
MRLPFVETYKGYTLNCAPQETHDQGFLAFVIITHGSFPVHVDHAAALDADGFAHASEAALAALGAAIRWVDEAVLRTATESQDEDVAMGASSRGARPALETRVAADRRRLNQSDISRTLTFLPLILPAASRFTASSAICRSTAT